LRCPGPASGGTSRSGPEELTLLPEGEARAEVDLAAASQASLNKFAAVVIRASRWDPGQAEDALSALREHNWAAGFDFEGEPAGSSREHHAGMAVRHVRSLEIARAWEKSRAGLEARFPGRVPEEALLRRSGGSPAALVYVVTHTALGAVKVGVSDPAGARIAQHRRAGWQLAAAFQVAADAAAAIEADVLGWWRGQLGLPPYLRPDQMPQGGWTETAAAGAIDLAAAVARICELALLPESRPGRAAGAVIRPHDRKSRVPVVQTPGRATAGPPKCRRDGHHRAHDR
jgi:hypothetical protein